MPGNRISYNGKALKAHLLKIGAGTKEAGLALLEEAGKYLEEAYGGANVHVDRNNNILLLHDINTGPSSCTIDNEQPVIYMIPWIQEQKLVVLFRMTDNSTSKDEALQWFLEMRNRQIPDTLKTKVMYRQNRNGSWYLRGIEKPGKILLLLREMEDLLKKDIQNVKMIIEGGFPPKI